MIFSLLFLSHFFCLYNNEKCEAKDFRAAEIRVRLAVNQCLCFWFVFSSDSVSHHIKCSYKYLRYQTEPKKCCCEVFTAATANIDQLCLTKSFKIHF